MEGDGIELLRDTRAMNATGNVRAVFPQTAGQSTATTMGVSASSKKPKLWHVTAGMLKYLDAENRAHLEKNVVAQSAEQKMSAPAVELYFTRPAQAHPNGATGSSPAVPTNRAPQISRALGTGRAVSANT